MPQAPFFESEEKSLVTHKFSDNVSDTIELFNSSQSPIILGVSVLYRRDGQIRALAVSNVELTMVLINCTGKHLSKTEPLHSSITSLFGDQRFNFTGFYFHRLVIQLKACLGIHLNGYDIVTTYNGSGPYPYPGQVVSRRFGYKKYKPFEVNKLWDKLIAKAVGENRINELVDRAWITGKLAQSTHEQLLSSTLLMASSICNEIHNSLLRECIWEIELLDNAKSSFRCHEGKVEVAKDGSCVVNNTRFKSRLRNDSKVRVVVTNKSGTKFYGKTIGAEGRKTTFTTRSSIRADKVLDIRSEGRESRTSSENASENYLRKIVEGKDCLTSSKFINAMWLDSTPLEIKQHQVSTTWDSRLNPSQARVVTAMAHSSDEFIVVVHGPPGTGKTSTISKATETLLSTKSTNGIWIVAQSNVGVKNVAETLAKSNIDFRLLVSKEFHFEWHEHLYPKVEEQLLRTDKFPKDSRLLRELFGGIQVVLCTLSSLSNPVIQSRIFQIVPVNYLFVDEASQISVFQYLHLFAELRKLEKVCFFGDPKQLPPYGKDAAPDLRSIFDVKHLEVNAYLLNIQYRMPVPLGDFISLSVYNGKLESEHKVTKPSCVSFIDVPKGEENLQGSSYVNVEEANAVVHLVREHFRHQNCCVITPYDAQRNFIHKLLKSENLSFEDVYNVDSFQGNEAKFIILSTVRTAKPGFLTSQNRVNVMLTRCKKQLVIVTNREFFHLPSVRETLLGKLCAHWEDNYGADRTWLDYRELRNPAGIRAFMSLLTPTTEKKVSSKPGVWPLANGSNGYSNLASHNASKTSAYKLALLEHKMKKMKITAAKV